VPPALKKVPGSMDANAYDLQNVQCQSLMPNCTITSRFAKRAISIGGSRGTKGTEAPPKFFQIRFSLVVPDTERSIGVIFLYSL